MKIRLLGYLKEQKIHSVSAAGPLLQFGRPPTAGRKMAAVLVHLNPNQLLLQVSLVRILGNDREVKKKKIVLTAASTSGARKGKTKY